MKTKFKLLCGAVALSLAGQACAAVEWIYAAGGTTTATTFAATAGGATGTATAWANTGPLGSPTNDTSAGVLAQQTINYFYNYGSGYGLGINNFDGCSTANGTSCDVGDIASSAPEHAIDNNQRNEMVLLSFDKSVNLSSVQFGWTGKWDGGGQGSEYTIFAYKGNDVPGLTGKSWTAASLGSDWVTIGNYADAPSDQYVATNTTRYSSYWLIGAYNPLDGSVAAGFSNGNDYLKLASVKGDVCTSAVGTGPNCTPGKVPEPGSLALVGFALMGMMGLRKRRQA